MGRIFVVELEGRSYRCKFCKTHLALADDLVSRGFHCRRGKAYLFNNAVNLVVGALEERLMLSGLHTVADIFCAVVDRLLAGNIGYQLLLTLKCVYGIQENAHERSQEYKEGKFVLERGRIVDEVDFSPEFYIDTRPSMSDAEDV